MSFMKPEMREDLFMEVESCSGSWSLPADLWGLTELGEVSLTIELKQDLADMCPEGIGDGFADDIQEAEIKKCWGVRLSAPGYLDCTDWNTYDTKEEALEELAENYDWFWCKTCGWFETPSDDIKSDDGIHSVTYLSGRYKVFCKEES